MRCAMILARSRQSQRIKPPGHSGPRLSVGMGEGAYCESRILGREKVSKGHGTPRPPAVLIFACLNCRARERFDSIRKSIVLLTEVKAVPPEPGSASLRSATSR